MQRAVEDQGNGPVGSTKLGDKIELLGAESRSRPRGEGSSSVRKERKSDPYALGIGS